MYVSIKLVRFCIICIANNLGFFFFQGCSFLKFYQSSGIVMTIVYEFLVSMIVLLLFGVSSKIICE